MSSDQKHPVIILGSQHFTKLLIRAEHHRLLHGGPRVVYTSQCVACRRHNARPAPQLVGQLPKERFTPGHVFDRVGIDYAGPFMLKLGHVRKPTIIKSNVCVFVSMSVKAVHLEPVTDLSTEGFISTLKRFIARRGLPNVILSDNGTNFVGANEFVVTNRTIK